MPLRPRHNSYISGTLVEVLDTESLERFEVYLNVTPFGDGSPILAIVDPLEDGAAYRREDGVVIMTPMWRCWAGQIVTSRWSAMGRPDIRSTMDNSMMSPSEALACDVVDAYRFHVLGLDTSGQISLVGK